MPLWIWEMENCEIFFMQKWICGSFFSRRHFLEEKNSQIHFNIQTDKKNLNISYLSFWSKPQRCNFHLVFCFMSKHACLIIRSIFFINKSNVSFEKFRLKKVKEFEMKTLLRRKILIGCKNGTNKKYEKCLTICWIRFHSESCRLTVYAGLIESKRRNRHLWYKSIEKNKQCVIFCNICLNKRINGGNVVMRIQCAHNCTQSWSSNEPIKRQKQFFYLPWNKMVFFLCRFFPSSFFSLTRTSKSLVAITNQEMNKGVPVVRLIMWPNRM